MNHYDDLQRFKDKTRNQALDFKDFSAQSQANDQGSWAILNQLLPATDANTLAAGGHVSVAAPQPVSAETFALGESAIAEEMTPAHLAHTEVPSILKDVAQQLASEHQDVVATVQTPVLAAARIQSPEPVLPQEQVNFSRLFAPAVSTPKPTAEKNQPLNSLLERIATCR